MIVLKFSINLSSSKITQKYYVSKDLGIIFWSGLVFKVPFQFMVIRLVNRYDVQIVPNQFNFLSWQGDRPKLEKLSGFCKDIDYIPKS